MLNMSGSLPNLEVGHLLFESAILYPLGELALFGH